MKPHLPNANRQKQLRAASHLQVCAVHRARHSPFFVPALRRQTGPALADFLHFQPQAWLPKKANHWMACVAVFLALQQEDHFHALLQIDG